MKNAINKQFEMNQGAHAENNTETSFRNPERVAQAGGMPMMASAPLNYGTTPPLNQNGDDPDLLTRAKNYVRNSRLNVRTTRPDSDRTTESRRIFGPTDQELADQKRIREKNIKQREEIARIKAGRQRS